MREKVRDLIYLDTKRYTSLDSLRVFYWGITIIPFFMVVISIVSINMTGVSWESLFPIVSFGIWSLFYWIFVLIIQSKRTKKTFELRFLVNGISGLLLSSLFLIFFASLIITSNTPFLKFNWFLWMLLFYLLFSLVYIFAIILCVHKGVFAWIREKSKTRTALMVSAFFGSLIPSAGTIGMHISRLVRAHVNISTQLSIMTILITLLVFIPALAHINFVQFYYCKKYRIDCDEDGNTMSPALERKPKENKRVKKSKKILQDKTKRASSSSTKTDISNSIPSKKRLPLIIKILIGIVSVPIIFFMIVFFVFFIKGFIQGIS